MRATKRFPIRVDPPLQSWPEAGVYQLRIRLSADARIRVGRLGVFHIPHGLYAYTGRASRGLDSRVMRYILPSGTLQWHVDYLLACKNSCLEGVCLASRDPNKECAVNQRTGRAVASCPDSVHPTARKAAALTFGIFPDGSHRPATNLKTRRMPS